MSYTICSRSKGEHIVYAGYTICTSREHIVYGAFCGSTQLCSHLVLVKHNFRLYDGRLHGLVMTFSQSTH